MDVFKVTKSKTFLSVAAAVIIVGVTTGILYMTGIIGPREGGSAQTTASSGTTDGTTDGTTVGMDGAVPLAGFRLEPLASDSTGTDIKAGFRLLSAVETTQGFIDSVLRIAPETEYTVETVTDKEFVINLSGEPKTNSIYKLLMVSPDNGEVIRSWAFQAKSVYKVVRTLPADRSTYVPLNSGIEIVFSHENPIGLDGYFEISPSVKGRFEYYRKTAVFIPDDPLAADTVYTVTVKKGASLAGSDERTQEDHIFAFQTEKQQQQGDNTYFAFTDILYNYNSKTIPALGVFFSEKYKDAELDVEIFKYGNENDFISNLEGVINIPGWTSKNRSDAGVDTSGMQSVLSFKAKIIRNNTGYWSNDYVFLPSTLPEGLYLACITLEGVRYQVHMQINDMAVYITIAKNRTLAWLNDTSGGNAIAGAAVSIEGHEDVISGNDGIAVIEGAVAVSQTVRDNLVIYGPDYYIFKIAAPGKPGFFAVVSSNNYYYGYYYGMTSGITDDYWTYAYLDRGLYLPDDTVHIWGILKPRGNSEASREITVQLYRNDYYYRGFYYDGDFPEIDRKTATLSSNGTYDSEFKLAGLDPGNYSIRIKYEGKVVSERYFQVSRYTKPSYKIDIATDKRFIFGWESVNASVTVNFFEGSPVPGLSLEYSYYNGSGDIQGKLSTDMDGKSSFAVKPVITRNTWYPEYINIGVFNATAEEKEVGTAEFISVFPRDVMINASGKRDGTSGIVEIETNLIDLSGMDSDVFANGQDGYKGDPVDMDLKAVLYEIHYDKKVIGTYYDYINKRTEKTYQYYEVRTKAGEASIRTSGGKASYEFPFAEDEGRFRYYIVELTGSDTGGREIVQNAYIYSWGGFGFTPEKIGYSFDEDSGNTVFKTGDDLNFTIRYNNGIIAGKTGTRSLFLTMRNGITGWEVSDRTNYNTAFPEDFVPNFYVRALYFDGSYINDTGTRELRFDSEEKNLKVNVRPDKDSYKPGETVNLKIDVTDRNNNPVIAEINISIVDEAFFALQDQYVDLLNSLYAVSISNGMITDYFSVRQPDRNIRGGAECGEGGDAEVRESFKDTAYFDTAVSGPDGKAEISFKLPDNLTSWRVTYQALTSDLEAGSGKIDIPVSLPFFTDIIFNDTFMEGDSPSVTIRSYGTGFEPGDDVSYTVMLEGGDEMLTFRTKAKAGNYTTINIGKLDEGPHTITVAAVSGSKSDTLKKEFMVVKGMLEASKIDHVKLTAGLKPNGGKGLTTLTFINSGAAVYSRMLFDLYYSWGDRLDQKLARKISASYLINYFGNDEIDAAAAENSTYGFSQYQLSDGGLALFRYDSSDPVLSAKVVSVEKEAFDTKSLAAYFYSVINNTESVPEAVASSYWGLASLGEPVLLEVVNMLTLPDFSPIERIYLGLALAELGDFGGASAVLDEMTETYGKDISPYYIIDTGRDKDETIEITSLSSALAMKIKAAVAEGMARYVIDNSAEKLLTNLEKLYYIMYALPAASLSGSFSYRLDGGEKTVQLENTDSFSLILTAQKLSSIEFLEVSGNVTVISRYTGPVADLAGGPGKLAGITRTYAVKDATAPSTVFRQSDLIKVTIIPEFKESAPDGYYEVTDIMPAAFAYIQPRYEYDRLSSDELNYPYEVSGQKVVFGFYHTKGEKWPEKIVYYVRAVCQGGFTADNAVIRHYDSDTTGFAERMTIKITD